MFGDPSNFSTNTGFVDGANVLTIKVLNATYQEGCAIAAYSIARAPWFCR